MRRLILTAGLALASACAAPTETPPPDPSVTPGPVETAAARPAAGPEVESILAGYTSWILLTPEPRNVSFSLWILCRSLYPPESAFLDSEHGSRYLRIYVNEVGAAAMALEGERRFPEGSVIVKEKLVAPDDASPAAIGIMIKRENGFNPEGGDWDYAYWEQNTSLAHGPQQLANCQACHSGEGLPESWAQDYADAGLWVSTVARDSVFLTLPAPAGD